MSPSTRSPVRAAFGYDAEAITVAGSDHFGLIFHALNGSDCPTLPDDPGGLETTRIILEAIEAARP